MCEEIDVLKEIFSTEDDAVLEFDDANNIGKFFIHAIPPTIPYKVTYPEIKKLKKSNHKSRESLIYDHAQIETPSSNTKNEANNEELQEDQVIGHSFLIEHLQPFELIFEIIDGYPSERCAKFLLKSSWLSKRDLSKLCHQMHQMWSSSRSDIFYTWVMFLQSESLSYLNYIDALDLSSIVQCNYECVNCKCRAKQWTPQCTAINDIRAHMIKSGYSIIGDLQQYNLSRQDYLFKREMFSCNICLEYERGVNCVKLNCGHINCRKCVKKFVDQSLRDNDFSSIRCPSENCRTILTIDVINSLRSKKLIQRYEELKTVTDLQADGRLVYCPRTFCLKPTASDNKLNLALCSSCKLAFCTTCKQTYHGINPCKLFRNQKERREVLESYRNGDSEARGRLEKIYGRKVLERSLDEMMSELEIERMCRPCPHCKSQIEKFEGCNKVHCSNCHQYFCWICSIVLDRESPYGHFSNPQSKCYRKLFEGVYDPAEPIVGDFGLPLANINLPNVVDIDDDIADDDDFVRLIQFIE